MALYSSISTQCNLFHKEKSSKLVQVNFVPQQKNKRVQCETVMTNKYSQTVTNSASKSFCVQHPVISIFITRLEQLLLSTRIYYSYRLSCLIV